MTNKDNLRFFQKIDFKILLSIIILIVSIESVLLLFSIGNRRKELINLRNEIYQNVANKEIDSPEDILSTQKIDLKVRIYPKNIISMIFLIIFVVGGGMYFIVRLILLKPILRIYVANRALSEGDETNAIIPEKEFTTDEIGLIMYYRMKMLEKLKLSEKQLVESKNYIDSIIANIADALIVIDAEGTVKTVNRATLDLLGYSEDELLNRQIENIFTEEVKPYEDTWLSKLIRQGKIHDYNTTCMAKTGDKIPVNFSGSVMHQINPSTTTQQPLAKDVELNAENRKLRTEDKQRIIGIVCILHDMRIIRKLMEKEKELAVATAIVTAERKRAAEINRIYEELKKSNAELKAAQSQLIQAEKLQVVGTLASGVAHEAKNPLAIIVQGIDYLSKKIGTDEENISLTLKYMTDASKRANNIIKGLLDFSSLSEVNLRLENLNSVIEDSLLLIKNSLSQYNIEVIKDFENDISEIKLDKNRIEQVLINIFMNSIQAMSRGGQLKIKTYQEKTEEKRKGVVVEIEDTGRGIPEEILGKIFDPFFTTKRSTGGTGLGLAIVRNIIEMHEGKITLQNKNTGGVRATIKFKA